MLYLILSTMTVLFSLSVACMLLDKTLENKIKAGITVLILVVIALLSHIFTARLIPTNGRYVVTEVSRTLGEPFKVEMKGKGEFYSVMWTDQCDYKVGDTLWLRK